MNPLSTFLASLAPGIDIVAGAAGMSEADLRTAGAPDSTAQSLVRLHESFFGATSFTGRQRAARAAAKERGHSLPALEVIDAAARQAPTQRQAWQLREQLCRTKADVLVLKALARKKLRAMKPAPKVKEGVRITRRKDRPWTFTITGDQALVADLHAAVPDLDAARQIFREGAAGTTVTTNVILTLDELDRVVDGDGEEVRLRMTNGAELTGAQLVQRTLSEHGYVTVIHPHEGPVNLYRTSRFANEKQRLMAGAENPVCPWAGCNAPADECQIHHLEPWRHGGQTNMANLATACAYHNGVNDDDAHAPPRRGRLARVNGAVAWLPPWAD